MTKKMSAGVLLYRTRDRRIEVFLVHPGGPYWKNKDAGSWTIPKGEIEEGDDPLATARREFHEETGSHVTGEFAPLAPLRQTGGKLVHAWAVKGDIDAASLTSNKFLMEWPPRSGQQREFPEIDRGEWFPMPMAKEKILPAQQGFLEQLEQRLEIAGKSG
jgi:predicted NUDIX family NTP pyrophosphohydrolase